MAGSRTDKAKTPPAKRTGTTTAPAATKEATKRLTLDVPESLHFAMKMRSVETDVPMVDEVTPLLMDHYADAMRRYRRP
jgi:hypothetical protein